MTTADQRPGVYEAMGGREACTRLAHAWHERVMADEVVAHAFSHGFHPEHTERLAAYLAETLGGPADFSERLGSHAGVVRMHAGNSDHQEMDDRAEACFAQALADADIPEPVRPTLRAYWHWATRLMAAYPRSAEDVPEAPMPHWTWDGPVTATDGTDPQTSAR
ncbi:oxidoreductase [Aestuariimicrobium soli]|uniref:globin domain-containing protein n=1 Tax=Aestuariimicrobium soli TaxID=2035834 RepID=UPI003EBBB40C